VPNPYNTSNAEDEGSFRQGYHAALKRIQELMACRGGMTRRAASAFAPCAKPTAIGAPTARAPAR